MTMLTMLLKNPLRLGERRQAIILTSARILLIAILEQISMKF